MQDSTTHSGTLLRPTPVAHRLPPGRSVRRRTGEFRGRAARSNLGLAPEPTAKAPSSALVEFQSRSAWIGDAISIVANGKHECANEYP